MILETVNNFLEKVFEQLSSDQIDVSSFELDHICYRVVTKQRYNEIKKELEDIAELLLENEIGGRLIATYKLNEPIIFQNRKIFIIELPQPKDGQNFDEGWEHVEFVIDESFEEFMNKYPNLTFKTKGIQKGINADIILEYDEFAVKFHHQSLKYVVKYLEK